MSRVDELKQRLQKVAYKGMVNRRGPQSYEEAMKGSHSDTMANTIQQGFNKEETRKNILDRIDPYELPRKKEVTCGASSEHCLEDWENVVEDGKIGGIEKIKGIGGVYTGPGAEHSFKRLGVNIGDTKPTVGHAWLELPDETIIDSSVGQFIDQKHEPLKQRQRFRIIPKESGLHKYYKKDPLLTHQLHMDDPERQVRRKLRKMGIDPFPSRKAKLKQRLAGIGTKDFDKDEKTLDAFDKGGGDVPNPDRDPSNFKLPNYSEEDYEAFSDYVQDSAFATDDMIDAGVSEDVSMRDESYAHWKDKPESIKQKLRPYYQKHLSKELSWQKNPKLYTSGKLPLEDQTYVKPGFHKNLKTWDMKFDHGVFTKDNFSYTNPKHRKQLLKQHEYLDINKKDIVPKTTRAFHDPDKYAKLKQRLARIPDPDSPEGKKLIDDLTDIAMKHRRKGIINSPRAGKPSGMRADITTPLIKEVPFGPQKYTLAPPGFGDPKAYEHIDHRPFSDQTFEQAEAKATEMGFPTYEEQLGVPKELQDKSKAFHVIPHGGVSIPKEQKRKILPLEKRNWETNKRLITRGKNQRKRQEDAEEIALDVMNDEKPSRLVNRKTKKIRPPKPVRSDFAEIITAKLKQRLASIPGLWEDQSISHISVPSETPKPMWNRKQIKRHYDASGPLKTKFITDAGKREAIGADKTIDDYFDKKPQGEKLTKQYKKLEGIGNKGLRKIPARRVVHNPFEGPSHGFDELSGLTDEGLPYRTRPSERFAPEPKEGSTEELESLIGIEPKLSFDESLKRYPRPKNVMYRSVAEKHAKLKQKLAVISDEEREFNENRKRAHPPIHRKDSSVSQYGETPLLKEVPFGPEDRTEKQILDDDKKAFRKHLTSGSVLGSKPGGKIRPRKPNQKERRRIIQARLSRLQQ